MPRLVLKKNRDIVFAIANKRFFENEVVFAELQSSQIINIALETIEGTGEELKQILQDVAHLF